MRKSVLILMMIFSFCLQAGSGMVIRTGNRIHPGQGHHVISRKARVVKPVVGWVDINTNQNQAKVYVNGCLAGNAGSFDGFPGKLELKPGTWFLKIQYGKSSYTQKILVQPGKELNLKVNL